MQNQGYGAISARDMLSPQDKVRERALIDSIMRLMPADEQRFFQSMLEKPGVNGSVPSFQKPEVRGLLVRLNELYSGPPAAPRTAGQIEADRAREANRTPVRVALVSASVMQGARILVVRTASDDGVPIVLLNEADGTDLEARAGIKAATTSLREHPSWSGNDSRIAVKVNSYRPDELTTGEIIEELKTEVDPHELAGFGKVRWTQVRVKRDPNL